MDLTHLTNDELTREADARWGRLLAACHAANATDLIDANRTQMRQAAREGRSEAREMFAAERAFRPYNAEVVRRNTAV